MSHLSAEEYKLTHAQKVRLVELLRKTDRPVTDKHHVVRVCLRVQPAGQRVPHRERRLRLGTHPLSRSCVQGLTHM